MHRKMENKSSQNNKGCIGQILRKYIKQLKYTAPRERGVLCGEPTPRPNPLPICIYIPFLTEKVPLSHIFYWKMICSSDT